MFAAMAATPPCNEKIEGTHPGTPRQPQHAYSNFKQYPGQCPCFSVAVFRPPAKRAILGHRTADKKRRAYARLFRAPNYRASAAGIARRRGLCSSEHEKGGHLPAFFCPRPYGQESPAWVGDEGLPRKSGGIAQGIAINTNTRAAVVGGASGWVASVFPWQGGVAAIAATTEKTLHLGS